MFKQQEVLKKHNNNELLKKIFNKKLNQKTLKIPKQIRQQQIKMLKIYQSMEEIQIETQIIL